MQECLSSWCLTQQLVCLPQTTELFAYLFGHLIKQKTIPFFKLLKALNHLNNIWNWLSYDNGPKEFSWFYYAKSWLGLTIDENSLEYTHFHVNFISYRKQNIRHFDIIKRCHLHLIRYKLLHSQEAILTHSPTLSSLNSLIELILLIDQTNQIKIINNHLILLEQSEATIFSICVVGCLQKLGHNTAAQSLQRWANGGLHLVRL